jgi:3-isopropylmalate/(R)-2-methylmalate dehydratase small subunit
VDTDQIIPVRFLTSTQRSGYADGLFADLRAEAGFVLNRPEWRRATVLVAGRDFGTGSSREAAVWALMDYGIRAVVAPRFGDIFRGNALKNGLLPVGVDVAVVEAMWAAVEAEPGLECEVDLPVRRVRLGDIDVAFELDDYTRMRLLNGLDETAMTLTHLPDIEAFEARRFRGYPVTTR